MATFAFNFLLLGAAFSGVFGIEQAVCLQNDNGACLEDQTSLLQTASTVQKREAEAGPQRLAASFPVYHGCGCFCSMDTASQGIAELIGLHREKFQDMIDGLGCSLPKMKETAKKFGHEVHPSVFDGADCSAVINQAKQLVPPKYKDYIPAMSMQCKGTLALPSELDEVDSQVVNTADEREQTGQQDDGKKSESQPRVAYNACGCKCSISAAAQSMVESMGMHQEKVQATIDNYGCALSDIKRTAKTLGQEVPAAMTNGASCPELVSAAELLVPAKYKEYLPVVAMQCEGSLALTSEP